MHNIKVINWAERRIKRRHKAPDLRLSIRAVGFKRWLRPSINAFCLDFNRYGMAINAEHAFKAKDKVVVSFKGKYISQSNVSGVITECIEQDGQFRMSIVFCYAVNSKDYNRKIDNALSRIESLYNQNQNQNHSQSKQVS